MIPGAYTTFSGDADDSGHKFNDIKGDFGAEFTSFQGRNRRSTPLVFSLGFGQLSPFFGVN
jgi:hypothetical protein